jgi:hypothetical protein
MLAVLAEASRRLEESRLAHRSALGAVAEADAARVTAETRLASETLALARARRVIADWEERGREWARSDRARVDIVVPPKAAEEGPADPCTNANTNTNSDANAVKLVVEAAAAGAVDPPVEHDASSLMCTEAGTDTGDFVDVDVVECAADGATLTTHRRPSEPRGTMRDLRDAVRRLQLAEIRIEQLLEDNGSLKAEVAALGKQVATTAQSSVSEQQAVAQPYLYTALLPSSLLPTWIWSATDTGEGGHHDHEDGGSTEGSDVPKDLDCAVLPQTGEGVQRDDDQASKQEHVEPQLAAQHPEEESARIGPRSAGSATAAGSSSWAAWPLSMIYGPGEDADGQDKPDPIGGGQPK